jgi:hypothetical protein
LDVKVHPDDEFSVEDAHEDLFLEVVLEVEQFGQELHVIRVRVLRVPQDLGDFVLHLIGHDLPLALNIYSYDSYFFLLSFFCLL